MREDSRDKVQRILSIYSRLKEGCVIDKAKEIAALGIAERTLQRDIADIQTFLSSRVNENGEVQEIRYERSAGEYRLVTRTEKHLSSQELLDTLWTLKGAIEQHCLLKICCRNEEKGGEVAEVVMPAEILREGGFYYLRAFPGGEGRCAEVPYPEEENPVSVRYRVDRLEIREVSEPGTGFAQGQDRQRFSQYNFQSWK